MNDVVDYQKFAPQGTSVEERKKMNIGDIYSNAAKCLKCGDVIRSRNRHDFVWCSCISLAVDGGSCYAKRLGNPENYENLVEMYDDTD